MKCLLIVISAVFLGLTWAEQGDENDHPEFCDNDVSINMINVFLSVISAANPPLCRLQISAPVDSTLYQVMVLGENQHPGMFSFKYKNFTGLGRYVTCINDECQMDPFYWLVYNGTTGLLLEKGIDQTYPGDNDAIIWELVETNTNDFDTNHTGQYMGPCATDAPIPSSEADVSSRIHVKLSAVNDRDPSWPPICNLPVLAQSGSTLGQVMKDAQDQHPEKFEFTTDVDTAHETYVESINDLDNDDPWYWLVYDSETMQLLDSGLDDTYPQNDDAYLWRFINKTHVFQDQDNGGTVTGTHLSLVTTIAICVSAILAIKML